MKMIARLFMLSFLILLSHLSFADTCPPAQNINPAMPPSGWTFLIGPQPDLSIDNYQFSSAIHSLNGFFL